MVGDNSNKPKWGASNPCPACSKNVYPSEQVFGADRKPWHRLAGALVGTSVGLLLGGMVGALVGALMGRWAGGSVGALVRELVGGLVG